MTNNIAFIRRLLVFFIIALFLSGVTAIPVDVELSWLLRQIPSGSLGLFLTLAVIMYYTRKIQW